MEDKKKTRKSYAAGTKMQAIKKAVEVGNRKAASEFGVDESLIRRWRKEVEVLSVLNKKRKARRGGHAKWPTLERELRQWIINKRNAKARVTTTAVRLHARVIAQSQGIQDFKATSGWYEGFMKRNGLSVRFRTSVGQPLPSDWTQKLELFRAYIAEKKAFGPVLPENIFNMDEVPCQFDMVGNRTLAEKGEEDISIVTTGSEKSSFTVVLCVSATGEKLKPMIIFKRKTVPKEKITSEVVVRANPKGWINGTFVDDWMTNVWKKRTSGFFKKAAKKESLLIYDSCTAHLTDEVKSAVQKHTELAVIPGGLTKYLQPLDISVNKSFKAKLREHWDNWIIDDSMVSLTKGGNRRRASYAQICAWIADAWKSVDTKVIKNGFEKAGLHYYNEPGGLQNKGGNMDDFAVELDDILIIEDDEVHFDGDTFDGFDDFQVDDDEI